MAYSKGEGVLPVEELAELLQSGLVALDGAGPSTTGAEGVSVREPSTARNSTELAQALCGGSFLIN